MEIYYGVLRPEEAMRILKSGKVADCGEYMTIKETADILGLNGYDVELMLLGGSLSSKPLSREKLISKLSLVRFLLETYQKRNDPQFYEEF